MSADKAAKPKQENAKKNARPPLLVWRTRSMGAPGLAPSLLGPPSQATGGWQEPFAAAGPHVAVAEGWREPWRRDQVSQKLQAFLETGESLVHTVDDGDDVFHLALAQMAGKLGYRQLVLHVASPADRLLALVRHVEPQWLSGAAPSPDALHPRLASLVQADRLSLLKLSRVHQFLSTQAHKAVSLQLDAPLPLPEEPSQAKTRTGWLALPKFLGEAAPSAIDIERQWREERDANHASAAALLPALHDEAQWLPGLALQPAFLSPKLKLHTSSAGPVRQLILKPPVPPLLYEGDAIRFNGLLLAAQPAQHNDRIVVRQGAARKRIVWGETSPALQAKFPDDAAAGTAKFKTISVEARRKTPAQLLLHVHDGPKPIPVADLSFEPLGPEKIDGIYLAGWSIGYQPIPKAACTSIKLALFEMALQAPFSKERGGGDSHIHGYFDRRVTDVGDADFKFLVVRDPILRFLSGFGNRVQYHKELSREYVSRLKLDPPIDLETFPFDPDMGQFVENFALYRQIPTINHHFRPISEFVAPLSAFDKVYPFESLPELASDLTARFGKPFQLPHTQKRGNKAPPSKLPQKVFDKLLEIYAADYKLLSGVYNPAALR